MCHPHLSLYSASIDMDMCLVLPVARPKSGYVLAYVCVLPVAHHKYWRICVRGVFPHLVQYAAKATTTLRSALKEPVRTAAMGREAVTYNRNVFVGGKPTGKGKPRFVCPLVGWLVYIYRRDGMGDSWRSMCL